MRPSITLWCQWVLKAWNDIDPAIIIKSFKKCCISNADQRTACFMNMTAMMKVILTPSLMSTSQVVKILMTAIHMKTFNSIAVISLIIIMIMYTIIYL